MGTLSKYRTMPLVISGQDAQTVLSQYFEPVPPTSNIHHNDIRFAQAIIVEAAEASAQVGFVQKLWEKAVNPAAKPLGLIKTIAKSTLKLLNHPKNVQDVVDTPNYTMVINSIAWKNKSSWAIRMQTQDASLLL